MKSLDTNTALNKLTTKPIPSINQNHLIIFTQNINNMSATIIQVRFESHIADQDFSNHSLIALSSFCHEAIASFILSKIKIFASIAIPTESISQAIDASVKTIQNILTIAKTKVIYTNKATADKNPPIL